MAEVDAVRLARPGPGAQGRTVPMAAARLDTALARAILALYRTELVQISFRKRRGAEGKPLIRLSRIADYGIVVMSHLARHPQRHMAAPDIASATGVPLPTTSKILKTLARAGLVASQRGVRGGYGLARPSTEIPVAAVIEALDGPIAITSCVQGGERDCDIERLCTARANWQRINDAIRGALTEVTLAEMAFAIPGAYLRPVAHGAERQASLAGGI